MPVTLNIRTSRFPGGIAIDAEQFVGAKPTKVQTPAGIVDGCEVIISLGVQPRPPHVVLAEIAELLEQGSRPRLVIPVVAEPK